MLAELGPEATRAILLRYPTPLDLYRAYQVRQSFRLLCVLGGLQWIKHVALGGFESKLPGGQPACTCLISTSVPACTCRRLCLLRPRQKGSAGIERRSACCAVSEQKGAPGICSTAFCCCSMECRMLMRSAVLAATRMGLCSALSPLGAVRLTPVCCAPPRPRPCSAKAGIGPDKAALVYNSLFKRRMAGGRAVA